MKRIARISLLCCCVLVLVVAATTLAQMKDQKAPMMQSVKPPAWIVLANGVELIRLWDTAKPPTTEPEIAILRLSDEMYALFRKDPTAFVNKYSIYTKPVRKLTAPEESRYTLRGGGWTIMIPHWPDSGARCASFTPAMWPSPKTGSTPKP